MKETILQIQTDDSYLESQQHGKREYPFHYYEEDVWKFAFHCINWHWHPELEIIYIEKGSLTCYIGSEKIRLSEGEGLFVNSGVLHRYETESAGKVPNIVFHPRLFGEMQSKIYQKYIAPVLNASWRWQALSPSVAWQKEVLDLLLQIFSIQRDKEFREIQTIRCLFSLWEILYKNVNVKEQKETEKYKKSQEYKLQIMLRFLQNHFQEQITLADIGRSISVSENTVLNIFRETLYISPISYLNEYRLTRAAELLTGTEKTISEIAEECGFSSVGYFGRKFKEQFVVSPREYRKKNVIIEIQED